MTYVQKEYVLLKKGFLNGKFKSNECKFFYHEFVIMN